MNNLEFGYQPSESNKGVKPNLPKTGSDAKKTKVEVLQVSNIISIVNSNDDITQ